MEQVCGVWEVRSSARSGGKHVGLGVGSSSLYHREFRFYRMLRNKTQFLYAGRGIQLLPSLMISGACFCHEVVYAPHWYIVCTNNSKRHPSYNLTSCHSLTPMPDLTT